MDDAFAGYQTYIIIEKNNGECPIRDPVVDGNGNVVNENGVVFISAGFVAPFTTWVALINAYPTLRSWVFDVDDGEGRYYDGTQAGDDTDFYPAEKRAAGKVENVTPANRRPMEKLPEIGEMYPATIKEGVYDATVTLRKVEIDKRKLAALSKTSAVDNQAGFGGAGLVEVNEFVNTEKSNWYLVIVYHRDLSSDAANFARVKIYPCTKFSDISSIINATKTVTCDIRGLATYTKSIPDDEPNIEAYTQANAPA